MTVEEASAALTEQVYRQLETQRLLTDDYPRWDSIQRKRDSDTPGAQSTSCIEVGENKECGSGCLLLTQSVDFMGTQAITWESAAFFMYRIYELPRASFTRVDHAQDFTALDVYALEDPELWRAVDGAINAGARALGARPFRP